MKTIQTLLIALLVSCNCSMTENSAKQDIEQFYQENNLSTGAGQTTLTKVEIISVTVDLVTAFVEGYYSNFSVAKPESKDFRDTLYFKYYGDNEDRKLKIVNPN